MHGATKFEILKMETIFGTLPRPIKSFGRIHSMKTYGGSRGVAPLILNLDTFSHSRYTPGKEPRYLHNRRLDGPQSQSEYFGKENNFVP